MLLLRRKEGEKESPQQPGAPGRTAVCSGASGVAVASQAILHTHPVSLAEGQEGGGGSPEERADCAAILGCGGKQSSGNPSLQAAQHTEAPGGLPVGAWGLSHGLLTEAGQEGQGSGWGSAGAASAQVQEDAGAGGTLTVQGGPGGCRRPCRTPTEASSKWGSPRSRGRAESFTACRPRPLCSPNVL